MNNLKKLFAAVVLISALAAPTFAGGIECGNPTPPPSGGARVQNEPDGSEASLADSSDALTESGDLLTCEVMALLQGVLALL